MIGISPRSLSNVYPIQSQIYPNIPAIHRNAVTPTTLPAAGYFFPPSSSQKIPARNVQLIPPNSIHQAREKNQTAVGRMDISVPSLGLLNVQSSPSPFSYEQEKFEPSVRVCGSTCSTFSNPSVDSFSEDLGLDDKMENSSVSVREILTPDVINTLHSMAPPEFSWPATKSNCLQSAGSFGGDPTLAQLNIDTDPDMSFVNEILNIEPSDGRINYSALDYLCNEASSDVSSTGLSNYPSVSTITTNSMDFGQHFLGNSAESSRSSENLDPSQAKTLEHPKGLSQVGSSYIRNIASVKNNFPPRESQPQLIGVVAPVKKSVEESPISDIVKPGHKANNLKLHSPHLHRLLSKDTIKSENSDVLPSCDMKSEHVSAATEFSKLTRGLGEAPAQIVPSSSGAKRSHEGQVKVEPTSPRLRKPLQKEESTEDKWKDIESFIHNPSPDSTGRRKRRRFDSGSSGHMSDDDDDDDDSSTCEPKDNNYDSDDDYSDIDADLTTLHPSQCESLVTTGKKQKQYFWQYNVQAKGPKGTRLKLAVEAPADPHVLNDFEDPVFDECNTTIAGIRHGGKARKGDGNEITPNPRKLFMIGHQLMRLNQRINACQVGAEVPLPVRTESRKEKNKLASQACRLKKKAQHEANKIKLYGLEQEHGQLNTVIQCIWPHIKERAKALLGQTDKPTQVDTPSPLTSQLETLVNQNLKGAIAGQIAGHTTDYVNNVILKVETGDMTGGLDIKKYRKT